MKMTLLFTILLISFQVPVRNKDFLGKINSAIYSKSKDGGSYSLHKKLISMDSLDVFINSDTLFILEGFDCVTAIYYGEMWDKNKHISYTSEPDGKITFDGLEPGGHNFPDYVLASVSSWDARTTRKINKNGGLYFDDFWSIAMIRIIINKGRIKVDYFSSPSSFPYGSRHRP